MGGSLENFILDRNFQSRSKSRIFLIFGPSGTLLFVAVWVVSVFRRFRDSRRFRKGHPVATIGLVNHRLRNARSSLDKRMPLLGFGKRIFSTKKHFLEILPTKTPTRNIPERVRDTIGTFPENGGKLPGSRKEPEGKNTKGKNFRKLRGRQEMFAEDISEDFSEDGRYHFYWFLEYFWISSKKSSRKIAFFWEAFGGFYPLGFYP